MKVDVYCDESGNSGGNYLDSQQPVFVLAGWSINRHDRHRADRIIERFKRVHFPDKTEMKGSEILTSNHGQKIANELFAELGHVGCLPFFILAEKRYCVAGKIVEAFFDSEHNHKIHPSFSWMNGIKKDIAQIIYEVSKESIEKFAYMHKNPSILTVKEAQLTVVNELIQSGNLKLAEVIEGASEYINDVLWEEVNTQTSLPRKAMHSLNLPVFIAFIQMLEKAHHMAGYSVNLVHDETKQFQEAYPEVFNLYKNAQAAEFTLENGNTILTGFRSIKNFNMKNSSVTPMIQAADLLASFINKYATNIIRNKKMTPEMKKIEELLIGSSLISMTEDLRLSDIIGSQDFIRRILADVLEVKDTIRPHPEIQIEPFLKS